MRIGLSIITADHGFCPKFDEADISYADIEKCRKAFGSLPDFDLGALGFEGIITTELKCFFVRCFPVRKWDFQGRDSTYIAVAYLSRVDAERVDVEKIFSLAPLNVPTKDPAYSFEVDDIEVLSKNPAKFGKGVYRREIGDIEFLRIEHALQNDFQVRKAFESREIGSPLPVKCRKKNDFWAIMAVVLVLITLCAIVAIDYYQSVKEESWNDASREMPSTNENKSECGCAILTNACRKMPTGNVEFSSHK
jgi:hypothetical protein